MTLKRDVLGVLDLVPVAWLESSWQVNGLSIITDKGGLRIQWGEGPKLSQGLSELGEFGAVPVSAQRVEALNHS